MVHNFHPFLKPFLKIILQEYIVTDDVCHQGDSGGPLTQEVTGPAGDQSFLIGVTSWGIGCGEVIIPTPGLSEQLRSNSHSAVTIHGQAVIFCVL